MRQPNLFTVFEYDSGTVFSTYFSIVLESDGEIYSRVCSHEQLSVLTQALECAHCSC